MQQQQQQQEQSSGLFRPVNKPSTIKMAISASQENQKLLLPPSSLLALLVIVSVCLSVCPDSMSLALSKKIDNLLSCWQLQLLVKIDVGNFSV